MATGEVRSPRCRDQYEPEDGKAAVRPAGQLGSASGRVAEGLPVRIQWGKPCVHHIPAQAARTRAGQRSAQENRHSCRHNQANASPSFQTQQSHPPAPAGMQRSRCETDVLGIAVNEDARELHASIQFRCRCRNTPAERYLVSEELGEVPDGGYPVPELSGNM